MLTITVDTLAAKKLLTDVRTKLPTVLATAMNYSAEAAKDAINRQINTDFKSPTPFTQRALAVDKATARTLKAKVWFKALDAKSSARTDRHYLVTQVFGGHRLAKQFEALLLKKGILPKGSWAVPGPAAELDHYGNMKPGQITQVVAWFEGFDEVGFKSNMTDATRAKRMRGTKKRRGFAFFAANGQDRRTAHLHPGIYKRTATAWGWAIQPVLLFVKRPQYGKRLKFFEAGNKAIETTWSHNLERAWKQWITS